VTLTLLLGGARSGKSAAAVRLGGERATLIATAVAGDDEMVERIRHHRAERPSGWTTVEEPVDLGGALAALPAADSVVIDCLTLWVANLIEAGRADTEIVEEARCVAAAASGRAGMTIAVSNEVGLGIVPAAPLARRYRDLLGIVNTEWAAAADRTLLLVAGRTLELDAVV
jgi:adenosyl cobinamide kinase/adenosyl cobinamide phosphate guanylyltransferase